MSLRKNLLDTFLLPETFDQKVRNSSHRADFICPQAFGRNDYSDRGVGSIIGTARDRFGDDITIFEWLRSQRFNPGRPNALLADSCRDLAETSGSRIIGQWEVMYDLYCAWPVWYTEHHQDLVAVWPPAEGYLATRELFLETKHIADGRGWKTPLLVAQPEHIQRCYFLARKIFDENPATSTDTISDEWFDPKSVQRWTRGKWHWLFYELCLARPHHLLKGWM